MATLRVTVNNFGAYILDAKLDLVNSEFPEKLLKSLVIAVISDYNPEKDYWNFAINEAINDGYSYHYWEDAIISIYYDKEDRN